MTKNTKKLKSYLWSKLPKAWRAKYRIISDDEVVVSMISKHRNALVIHYVPSSFTFTNNVRIRWNVTLYYHHPICSFFLSVASSPKISHTYFLASTTNWYRISDLIRNFIPEYAQIYQYVSLVHQLVVFWVITRN